MYLLKPRRQQHRFVSKHFKKQKMVEQEHLMTDTAWGLNVVIKEGVNIDDSNLHSTIKLIIDRCSKIGKRKILIDATNTFGKVSFMQLFSGVELIKKLNGTGFSIALIAPHFLDNKDSKFVEIVGHNRGISIQFFHDKDEAEKWLLK
jgi:hypothetical protein